MNTHLFSAFVSSQNDTFLNQQKLTQLLPFNQCHHPNTGKLNPAKLGKFGKVITDAKS